MVATYRTPGVYVEELPGGARAVEGVATSVTAFLGYTLRGPIGSAVRIASWGEYERKFGGIVGGESRGINRLPGSVDYMGHAVLAYFQNGGGVAYIVRMAEDGGSALPLAKARSAIMQPAPLEFEAIDEGQWANGLIVDVALDPVNSPNYLVVVGRLDSRARLTRLERYGDVTLSLGPKYLGAALVSNRSAVRISDAAPTAVLQPTSLQHGRHRSDDIAALNLASLSGNAAARTLTVALGDGTTTGTVSAQVTGPYASFEALAADLQALLRAGVSEPTTPPVARDGVMVNVIRDGAAVYLEVVSGFGGPGSRVVVDGGGLGAPSKLKFLASGRRLGAEMLIPGRAELFGGANGRAPAASGLYDAVLQLLELNDEITVLLTPNAAWDAAGEPIVDAVVQHCERMKNRVAIIDPPLGAGLEDPVSVNALGLPPSTYGQLYFPWVRVVNPLHHPVTAPGEPVTVLVPPAGFAAGMWARIDARRGVWKAPAGVETFLSGVDGFEFDIGDTQQEVLNPLGVNVLRAKSGYGKVIWGTRTLATNSHPEWRYIPVRRTAIMIEESLRRGIAWAVFEPNDEQLWSSLRLTADAFLSGLFRSGAFQGNTASEAYEVACGLGSTMEQGDIDRGYVILRVGFQPVKPAEFVVIQIQQLAGPA